MSSASDDQRSEQRRKLIAYGVFGALVLGLAVYEYEANYAGTDTKPPVQAPVIVDSPGATVPAAKSVPATQSAGGAQNGSQTGGTGVAPGVAAKKMASTSSSLDPTLDETAMLRTESLVYSGNGRNIFSQTAYVAPVALPKVLPNPRGNAPVGPPVQPPPPPTCPPTCPPINLKYFGTVVQTNGLRQAFLLHDDDVYMASQGDIVARRYKIVSISANSVKVEDLSTTDTQTLPLQTN